MLIREIMEERQITVYRLAKLSGVPISTVNDIYHGKAKVEKCTAETVYKLAKSLDISMDILMESCLEKRIDFELFKSNVCHQVKELGDVPFIIQVLESNDIRSYHRRKWYAESLYLLAMLDYISRENNVPYCKDYDDLRKCKLAEPLYPASIRAAYQVSKNEDIKQQAYREAIPEFIRFNIVESEVRNVV